ncbi:hypothetical protein ACFFRR_006361 [Megaselia abdita]
MKWFQCYAFIILLFVVNARCEFTSWRLPNTTTPIEYNISVKVVSKSLYQISEEFSGIVEIKVKVTEETSDLYLHSKFANIFEIVLTDVRQKKFPVDFKSIPERELVHINSFNERLIVNEYTIKISYASKLRTDKLGFHLSSYVNSVGQKIDIASTQFAPTEARHAFPCFDEPKFKANFTVSVTHPKEYHALGNMEIASKDEMNGLYTTTFRQTPMLSTYLVSFIVSNLPHTTIQRKNFTQELYVKESGQPFVKDGEQFAADVLQKFMETFDTAPLPLTTMKQVAIPNFYFNGMENFGSVFYNEHRWFYDPAVHSIDKLLSLKALLSHEMSHQWFGDLVTMEWWTHVWLNEGFATLMGYYGTEMVDPKSNIMQQYQTDVFMNAMIVDEAKDIRYMSKYVEVPEQIMKHYDKIAYDKASCVIRMFEDAIGKKEFKKGLDLYFENKSFKNANEDDLFKYLQDGIAFFREPDIDVKDKMSVWTGISGLPVVNVSVDYLNGLVKVEQKRFMSKNTRLWPIPLTFISSSNATKSLYWLTMKEQALKIDGGWSLQWILFNVNQRGYYRVNYDQNTWKMLGQVLRRNYKTFSWENRAQLVNDAFDMARTHYVSNFSLVLDLLHFYQNETELSPWVVFDKHVSMLSSRLSGFEIYKNFENFMKFLLLDQRKKVLKEKYESPTDRLARKMILKNSCDLEECSLDENDVDLRTQYYCGLLRKNQDQIVIAKVNEISDIGLRSEVFRAFGCGTSGVLKKLLSETLNTKNNWSSSEIKVIYESMYRKSSEGFESVLQFWLENIDDVAKLLTIDGFNDIVVEASKFANTESNQDKIRTLVSSGDIFKTVTKEATEENIINTNLWFSWHKDNIDQYLQQYNGSQSRLFGAGFLILLVVGFTLF